MTDVLVVLGSESDGPQANKALAVLKKCGVDFRVSYASCHRNIGGDFEEFVKSINERVILAIGGMTFAAPGIMSSLLRNGNKHGHIIIAAPLDEAARSAIEDLPKGTVVLTCGLNQVSVSHSLENAALAAVQLNAIFKVLQSRPEAMMSFTAHLGTTAKPLVAQVVLGADGLIPEKEKK
jgi:phosphoribosylcarboxyaminoimidazole (NCAIR) mutase